MTRQPVAWITVAWIAAIACLGAAWSVAASAAPLSSDDRTTLAKQTGESCLTGQAKEAANMKLTIAKLQDFCTCYGEGIAANMQTEDLVAADDAVTPKIEKLAATYFQSCAASVFKK